MSRIWHRPKIIKLKIIFSENPSFSDSVHKEIRLRFQNGREYAFSDAARKTLAAIPLRETDHEKADLKLLVVVYSVIEWIGCSTFNSSRTTSAAVLHSG
jgi:hypothetical protein